MKIFHPNSIYRDISFPLKVKISSKQEIPEIPEIPVLPNLNFTANFGKKFSTDELLKTAFNSNASCAIALSLFVWVHITPRYQSAFPLEKNISLHSVPNDVLFSAVTDAIRHPPCIVNAASEYIQEVFSNKKFIVVHWRYDKRDFGRSCNPSIPKAKRYYCDNMHKIKPKTLALGIMNATNTIAAESSIPVYIASPPLLEPFVNEVYEELEKLNKNLVKPFVKLSDFLSSKYNTCWNETGWTNKGDILSVCEMEIMIRSNWFLFSGYSSWSQVSRCFRIDTYGNGTIVKRFEANVFDFAVTAYEALKYQEATTAST